MVEPYVAMCVQNTLFAVKTKSDVKKNLDNICDIIDNVHYSRIEYPIRLIAIPEASFQTFVDSQMDLDPREVSKTIFDTTCPGEETDILAEYARKYRTYICGQIRAKEPDIVDDLYFNIGYVIDPNGRIILKHHKTQVFFPERSCTPHDIWDTWVEKFGKGLDSFFPVARTEIGNIGACICMETSYPETARGLAMNGAEIIYMPTYIGSMYWRGTHEAQLRARALDNNCYVISPNTGDWYLTPKSVAPTDLHGGNSMIIDYSGNVLVKTGVAGNSYCTSVIDIEALRYWRENSSFGNWIKDLRTEQFRAIYEAPIYPKNLFLKKDERNYNTQGRKEILAESAERLVENGTYTESMYNKNKEKKKRPAAQTKQISP